MSRNTLHGTFQWRQRNSREFNEHVWNWTRCYPETREAAWRRAAPLRFNLVARAKLEVAQPIRCRLRAVFTAHTLRYTVTVNFDLVTLTFDLEHFWFAGCAVVKLYENWAQ